MRLRLLALAVVLSSATLSGQQPAQLSPEQKRLQFFVGEWKFEGQMKESPYGPGGKVTGTERCEWFEGGYRPGVVCRIEDNVGGQQQKDLIVMSYDPDRQLYTRYNIGSSGVATAKLEGKVWQWEAGPDLKGTRFRFPVTELSPDSYSSRVEISKDGKTFVTIQEGTATRVK